VPYLDSVIEICCNDGEQRVEVEAPQAPIKLKEDTGILDPEVEEEHLRLKKEVIEKCAPCAGFIPELVSQAVGRTEREKTRITACQKRVNKKLQAFLDRTQRFRPESQPFAIDQLEDDLLALDPLCKDFQSKRFEKKVGALKEVPSKIRARPTGEVFSTPGQVNPSLVQKDEPPSADIAPEEAGAELKVAHAMCNEYTDTTDGRCDALMSRLLLQEITLQEYFQEIKKIIGPAMQPSLDALEDAALGNALQ